MNSWINLSAVGAILGLGLLLGAGLPAVFALGLRALSVGLPDAGEGHTAVAPGPVRVGAAVVCFAVVLAAIGAGIYLIVSMT